MPLIPLFAPSDHPFIHPSKNYFFPLAMKSGPMCAIPTFSHRCNSASLGEKIETTRCGGSYYSSHQIFQWYFSFWLRANRCRFEWIHFCSFLLLPDTCRLPLDALPLGTGLRRTTCCATAYNYLRYNNGNDLFHSFHTFVVYLISTHCCLLQIARKTYCFLLNSFVVFSLFFVDGQFNCIRWMVDGSGWEVCVCMRLTRRVFPK